MKYKSSLNIIFAFRYGNNHTNLSNSLSRPQLVINIQIFINVSNFDFDFFISIYINYINYSIFDLFMSELF
jgi:hypothetical protein